jgi:D-tyrosyl-tRNA(Tyr) deacylase
VTRASVTIDGEVVGRIGPGLLALVGAGREDDEAAVAWTLRKTLDLRIFSDDQDRMNRSLLDVGGALLLVSQFTLYGDCRKGRRPSFASALAPDRAEELYDLLVKLARAEGLEVATGRFGAMMDVALVNDGPVTLLLDSQRRF